MIREHRWWVLLRMAAEPDAEFATLSQDQTHNVRSEVARNLHTPPDILRKLATDTAHDVRMAVAANPNTPPEALYDLAKDEVFSVRTCVLRNPSISLDIAHALMRNLGLWPSYQAAMQHYFHGVWVLTHRGRVRFLP